MRLDYSEKVGALREGAERRGVQRNRPRKAPVGMLAFLSVLVVLGLTFGAGVFTGWYLFKGDSSPAVAQVAPPVQQVEPVAPAAPPGQETPAETPLTFYKTLPSGGEAPMGSGMNLKLEPAPQPKEAPAPAPAASSPAEDAAGKPAAEKPAAEKAVTEKPAVEKKGADQVRYVVQVASYRDKKEAEQVQAKLSAKGVAAYLVESRVKDKGVWYRLRAGRGLSRQEAEQLQAKVGGGAAILAE